MKAHDAKARARTIKANKKSLMEIRAVKAAPPTVPPKKLPGYYERLEMKVRGYAGEFVINRG